MSKKGIWDGNVLLEYPNLEMPEQEKEVDIWQVSWLAHKSDYTFQNKHETASFTSKEKAVEFADKLKQAFKFLRVTYDIELTIKKQ